MPGYIFQIQLTSLIVIQRVDWALPQHTTFLIRSDFVEGTSKPET
jgi:hypothetical protein